MVRPGAAASGAFRRDQRNVAVAAGAQTFEHVHQLAIRDAAVGAHKEDAAVAVFAPIASSVHPQQPAFHRWRPRDRL